MKNALILHGAGNNSSGNWFPWLKKELESGGYRVWLPDLPNADHPKIEEWLNAVKDWKLDDDSIIIGHSCGGTLILRILENLPLGQKIKKAILVAAPLDKGLVEKYWPLKEDLAKGTYDFNKIKNSSDEFVLIYSDNDPYDCGLRHGELIHSKVGGKLIIEKGEGHFNLDTGQKYKEFSEILEYLNE